MSDSIQLPAARQPVTYTDPQSGVTVLTRPWFLFFQRLFERLGGPVGTSVNDLAEGQTNPVGVEELKATVNALQDSQTLRTDPQGLEELKATVIALAQEQQTMRAELAESRELVFELRKDIQSISQGTAL